MYYSAQNQSHGSVELSDRFSSIRERNPNPSDLFCEVVQLIH